MWVLVPGAAICTCFVKLVLCFVHHGNIEIQIFPLFAFSVYHRANMIRCRRLGVGNVDLFDDIFSNTRLQRFACKERHWRTWWWWFPSMDVVEVSGLPNVCLTGLACVKPLQAMENIF